MSNPNAPFGLRPIGTANGQPYTGAARVYSIPAGDGTAVFIGDAVKLVGTGQIINGSPYTDVAIAATGDVFVGAVIGVLPATRDSLTYRAASTQRLLLVADDPDLLFEAQQRNAGTALNVNDIGLNANIQVVAGSTVTGYSATVVDTTGPATTNTLDVKIMGIVDDPANDIGASASAGTAASRLLVRINRHAYANQIAGV
jgi:hypothetical protein